MTTTTTTGKTCLMLYTYILRVKFYDVIFYMRWSKGRLVLASPRCGWTLLSLLYWSLTQIPTLPCVNSIPGPM